jgi:hypothetical protein
MRDFAARMPPPKNHPFHELFVANSERALERDRETKRRIDEAWKRIPSFTLSRMQGGSGFPLSKHLRSYFIEYFSRLANTGPCSFPTSFNVVESFLEYTAKYFAFDLRQESEHLVSLSDYVDWYSNTGESKLNECLISAMTEGVVYEYHASDVSSFAVELCQSKIRVLGVGLVRHEHELSIVMLAGEHPPRQPESEIESLDGEPYPGRECIEPAPDLSVGDRYLETLPDHVRVVLLARLNLQRSSYDVRYVNVDMGHSYQVLTDDLAIYGELIADSRKQTVVNKSLAELGYYDALFSLAISCVYLPVFFLEHSSRIVGSIFSTELFARAQTAKVRKAVKQLGREEVTTSRTVRCLAAPPSCGSNARRIVTPPQLEFRSDGYWMPLAPGEIGQDKHGSNTVGRTWVERTVSWSAQTPETFVASRSAPRAYAPNAGHVYIMRCGTHAPDLYKVGLTKRNPDQRADELSAATGVPTAVEVVASWFVSDCVAVEREAHRRLHKLRVNKHREFFRCQLSVLVATIEEIVRGENA